MSTCKLKRGMVWNASLMCIKDDIYVVPALTALRWYLVRNYIFIAHCVYRANIS